MATVRDGFQGSLLAELWFNMKVMILKWQKSSAVINAISHCTQCTGILCQYGFYGQVQKPMQTHTKSSI